MNKKEFFAAVNLYKRQPEIVQWKNDFLPKAIAASAKEILAHSAGNDEDAMTFANELASYTKKLDWLPDSEFAKISSLIEHSAEELVEKYSGALDEGVLEHGTKWKDHKYIRIENGRYIYPEDLKKGKTKSDPNKAKEQSYDIDAKYNDIYAKRGRDSVQFFGSRASNKTEAVEGYEEEFARGKRMAEEGARDAAVSRAQASGMRRTDALKEGLAKNEEHLARKEAFTKETEDIAKANEERKETEAKKAAVRAKDDSSKNAAQSEGEAQQKWKNEQDARKEYDNNIKKYAKDSINSIITQVTKGNTVVNYSDDELDKKLSATNFDTDKINTDFAKALTEEWLSKKDSVDPSTRSGIDGLVSSLINMRNGKSIKPKKLGHSIEPLSKDDYYAAIAEYKRKKA